MLKAFQLGPGFVPPRVHHRSPGVLAVSPPSHAGCVPLSGRCKSMRPERQMPPQLAGLTNWTSWVWSESCGFFCLGTNIG